MRFCHVSTFYPPMHFGGDAILAQAICEGLVRRGHEVTVVHSADAYTMRRLEAPPVEEVQGVRRIPLRSGVPLLSSAFIQQTGRPGLLHRELENVLRQPFDVVHFHNVSLIGGPGVFPLSRAPVTLHTTHDHWLFCTTHVLWKNGVKPCDTPTCFSCAIRSGTPPQLWRLGDFTARALESVDCLLSPSKFTAERHLAAGISRPIRHLPSFSSIAPHAARTAARHPRFVYAGRLVRSKGVEQLLDTVASHPEWRLDVVGSGPLEHALRKRFRHAEHIQFHPMVEHSSVPAIMAGATAVVVPSWGPEVFSLTIIEAMACGVPVVARRAGGSAESVEATGGGLVYDAPEELDALLSRLANDRTFRDTLAERAVQGVAEHYGEDRWFAHYFSIIEEIASAKSASAPR